jgi:hypothetical protein
VLSAITETKEIKLEAKKVGRREGGRREIKKER